MHRFKSSVLLGAALALWAAPAAQAQDVFVNGHPASLDNKHRTLYERYRAR